MTITIPSFIIQNILLTTNSYSFLITNSIPFLTIPIHLAVNSFITLILLSLIIKCFDRFIESIKTILGLATINSIKLSLINTLIASTGFIIKVCSSCSLFPNSAPLINIPEK